MLSSYSLVLITSSPTAIAEVTASGLLLTRGALMVSSNDYTHVVSAA